MGAATLTAVKNPEGTHWRPLLGAMSKTGGAALASGLLSALVIKTIAMLAGPAQVALFATLQQLRQAGLVAATANGQTAVVCAASGLDGERRREFLRTSAFLFAGATSIIVLLLALAPHWVTRWAGLPALHDRTVAWLAVPVACSSLFVFLSALLNSMGKIGDLAALQIFAGVSLLAAAWPASRGAVAGRPETLAWLLGFSAAASAGAAWGVLFRYRKQWVAWFRGPGRMWVPRAARDFGAMSGSMLVSGLAASAVLLLVRGRILSAQGPVVTGQFDAAWGISMNHVTLVLSSLQTYYLPALARSRSQAERNGHISRALTVTALSAAAVIAGIAWLKPQLIVWLYADEFRPGAAYLRWTLAGDYLKVTSWILSVPILAAAEMKVFLAADLAAYGTFWGAALVLARWFTPAVSAAMAFVCMYAAHAVICGFYLFRHRQFRLTRTGWLAWISGLIVVAGALALTWTHT